MAGILDQNSLYRTVSIAIDSKSSLKYLQWYNTEKCKKSWYNWHSKIGKDYESVRNSVELQNLQIKTKTKFLSGSQGQCSLNRHDMAWHSLYKNEIYMC